MTLSAAITVPERSPRPDLGRVELARPDLAELALEGIVRAAAYRATTAMQAVQPVTDIHRDPDPASDRIDQLLFGEVFDVLEIRDDYGWGRARRDGTVGWVALTSLKPGAPLPTRRVASAKAFLPLNALLVADMGLAAEDISDIGVFETDPAAVAERLLGVPYALGGRSSQQTDCSGLVQQALLACGLAGSRHSDEQADLGTGITRDDLRRGDLVVWLAGPEQAGFTGHSALVVDTDRIIHATRHHGTVVIESLMEAETRYAAARFSAPVFRRL